MTKKLNFDLNQILIQTFDTPSISNKVSTISDISRISMAPGTRKPSLEKNVKTLEIVRIYLTPLHWAATPSPHSFPRKMLQKCWGWKVLWISQKQCDVASFYPLQLVFSYASSSTPHPCQPVRRWAEFRTSVASRLASLLLYFLSQIDRAIYLHVNISFQLIDFENSWW